MQLIIDIPENVYKYLKQEWVNIPEDDSVINQIMHGILYGTPIEERPQSEWYYNYQNGWHCSICHTSVKDMPTVNGKADFHFCPNCGAKMKHDTKQ